MFSYSLLFSFGLFILIFVRKILPVVRKMLNQSIEDLQKDHDNIEQKEKEALLTLETSEKKMEKFKERSLRLKEEIKQETQAIEEETARYIEGKEELLKQKKEIIQHSLEKKKDLFILQKKLTSFNKALKTDLQKTTDSCLLVKKK